MSETNLKKHSVMLDAKGIQVKTGQPCRFWAETREGWLEGTVRNVRTISYYNEFEQREDVWEALVDDGDLKNPDPWSNGFHVTAWVESQHIEVKIDRQE
jgi:hypothetical protein